MKTSWPSPAEVEERLRAAAQQSDLTAGRRLDAKIDMSPGAVEQRLRQVARLRELCLRLSAFQPPREPDEPG